MKKIVLFTGVVLFASGSLVFGQSPALGIFSGQADVGKVAKTGSATFDAVKNEYTISGGGENIWFTNDAFHFVWKKMSGDFTLTADIKFLGTAGNPHRKACLFARQSLDASSAYADVAVHGVGLTALQYREADGETTHEIQSEVSSPSRVRLEKRGDYFSMWVAPVGGELKLDGGYQKIPLQGDFYVGLGVSAHDNKATERRFSPTSNSRRSSRRPASAELESTLETIGVSSTDRSVVYHTRDHIEAPNWSHGGNFPFQQNWAGFTSWRPPRHAATASTPAWPTHATTITAFRPTARSSP